LPFHGETLAEQWLHGTNFPAHRPPGRAGRSYTIQTSSNLLNWSALTNFVSATGTNQFTDASASNFNRRFYRAVTP